MAGRIKILGIAGRIREGSYNRAELSVKCQVSSAKRPGFRTT